MAIRNRGYGNHPWQVYWNNPITGKRESASFATKEEAEKENSLITHRLKYDKESFLPEEKEEVSIMTVEEAFLLYLKAKNFSRVSLRNQICHSRGILDEFGQVPLSDIGKDTFIALQAKFTAQGLKETTIGFYLRKFRAFLNWTFEQGYREPLETFKIPHGQYERFITPTQDELERIYAAGSQQVRRALVLGAYFGVRTGNSELLKLTWQDVNLKSLTLHIHGSKKNVNAEWREVPINKDLVPLFLAWQEEDGGRFTYIVHNYSVDKPCNCGVLQQAWRRVVKVAGITRRIRLYDLRHYFGTELVAAGVDVGTVARLMGHANPTMLLKHYQYVKDQQKVEAVNKLPSMCLNHVSKKTKAS